MAADSDRTGMDERAAKPASVSKALSCRVPAGPYFTALLPTAFIALFLSYIEAGIFPVLGLVAVSTLFIVSAITDRVVFDGMRLRRSGLLPVIWGRINRSRTAVRLKDIEFVRTRAYRSFRQGGRVLYAYRTTFYGRGIAMTTGSRGANYRRMMRAVLPLLPSAVLDRQTVEIRDYLMDPAEVLLAARKAGIPAADVLENSFENFQVRQRRKSLDHPSMPEPRDQNFNKLRILANQLKVSGRLVQALEAFRRALVAEPQDGWLLLESARCLLAFADVRGDERLERRAEALMRLSEHYAGDDLDLLTTLGESYFQVGNWRRAAKAFDKAVQRRGGTARALRGLAEIALREGKLAHVIHNFSAANVIAETGAVRRWVRAETKYFSRLFDDDEYLELELGRVSLLDTLRATRASALRISLLGFVVIAAGDAVGDATVANIGWAVSGLSIIVFTVAATLRRLFSQRIPPDTLEET